MMCYLDTTFCEGDGCIKFSECPRALTQDVRERAKACGLFISRFTEPKKLHCYRASSINRLLKEVGDEEILLADGFDEALIGTARRISGTLVAVYDRAKCIEILSREMSPEDAEEYFSFNTEGAWVGEQTPIFLETEL